jgi:hypothetical protein
MAIWDDTAVFMQDANSLITIGVNLPVKCWQEDYEEVALPGEAESGVIAEIIAVSLPTADAAGVIIGDLVVVDGVNRIVKQRRLIHEGKFTHLLLEETP